jgi:glycosyltransferase involved in cell wall biosynthesis
MLDRHEPMRGFDIGVEAFELLKKEYGDKIELKIFGNIPQGEMYKHYGSSHFYLGPSRAEGLPLPPLEAMSCGAIPIVTHFGTQDYIIDGQNGFFVNSNDVKHTHDILKKCIDMCLKAQETKKKDLAENTAYDMISCVSRLTADKWSWNNMIDGFENNLKYLGH